MRKTPTAALAALVALTAGAFCPLDVQAADLLQIYRQALANDSQYASARAALAAGLEKLPQGRSLLMPTIGITGTNTKTHVDVVSDTGGITNATYNSSNYSLSLSQPLFRWANWQQYEQSKLSVAASQAQFAQAQQDLILRAAQAYFDVLSSENALETLSAQKIATTEQLASAKRNFEVGTQTITDTHEAQARYDLITAQEFAAANDLQIKRTALQAIIGKEAGTLSKLKPGVTISAPQPAVIDEWVASAEKQNYSVVSAELGLESAKRDISRNRAGHMPTLDLVAQAGRTGGNATQLSSGNSNQSRSIGLSWSIPLFSGFAVNSRVKESIALEEKARSDRESARRNASQGARQAFLGVNSGLAQIKALEAAEVSTKSALESNKLGYQVGVRINIDVLNAQQQVYSTQRDLAKARYDTIINGLRLKSAAGTLKEADLEQINALLQP